MGALESLATSLLVSLEVLWPAAVALEISILHLLEMYVEIQKLL